MDHARFARTQAMDHGRGDQVSVPVTVVFLRSMPDSS